MWRQACAPRAPACHLRLRRVRLCVRGGVAVSGLAVAATLLYSPSRRTASLPRFHPSPPCRRAACRMCLTCSGPWTACCVMSTRRACARCLTPATGVTAPPGACVVGVGGVDRGSGDVYTVASQLPWRAVLLTPLPACSALPTVTQPRVGAHAGARAAPAGYRRPRQPGGGARCQQRQLPDLQDDCNGGSCHPAGTFGCLAGWLRQGWAASATAVAATQARPSPPCLVAKPRPAHTPISPTHPHPPTRPQDPKTQAELLQYAKEGCTIFQVSK